MHKIILAIFPELLHNNELLFYIVILLSYAYQHEFFLVHTDSGQTERYHFDRGERY